MSAARRKKSPFSEWLLYVESLCRFLYNSGSFDGRDLNFLYRSSIRLSFAVMFRKLAELQSHPPEPYANWFLKWNDGIPLEPVEICITDLPDGISGELFPDPEFPGRFYGECLQYTLEKNRNGTLELTDSRTRRQSGTFYTPEVITDYIARESITPLISYKSPGEILRLRICDPAMGTGNFLSAAARFLTGIIQSKSSTQENLFEWNKITCSIVKKCLFGIDRDPIAVLIARAYFGLMCGILPEQVTNFIVADSLLDPHPFKERFNVVIGNPPWVSFGLRDLQKIPTGLDKKYREMFPKSAEYKISIYALFIEKALELTKQGGFHGFIVPDSWLTGRFFMKLRSHLLEKTSFNQLILILRDFWKGLNIGRCVVYIVQKSSQKRSDTFIGAIIPNLEQLNKVKKRNVQVNVNRILKRDRKRIVIYPNDSARRIVEHMEDSGEIVGDYVRFYSGLIGKKGRDSIVIKGKPSDYSPELFGKLIESGKRLDKHCLTFTHHYMKHQPDLYKSGYDIDKYVQPKIFLNQTGFILKACFDNRGFFCLNNLHIGYSINNSVDLRFYSVLLNSVIMNYYYRVMSMEQGRALAQTDIDFLHRLPLGTDSTVYPEIIRLLDNHFLERTNEEENGWIRYSYHIPQHVLNSIEELLCEWYGLKRETIDHVRRTL